MAKKWWIILIIAAFLVGGLGGFWGHYYLQNYEDKKGADVFSTQSADKQNDETAKATNDDGEEAVDYTGWETYTNDVYNYQFRYPSDAEITEAQKVDFSMSPEESAAGKTFDELYAQYTGKICVSLKSESGLAIYFSAPENKDFERVICGRTSLGVGEERTPREETLTIGGKTYTASGDTGETGGVMIVTLDDGTRIEYDTNLDDTDMLAVIHKIIESYEVI